MSGRYALCACPSSAARSRVVSQALRVAGLAHSARSTARASVSVPVTAVDSQAVAGRNSAAGDGSVRSSTLKGSAAKAALLNSITSSKESRMFKIGEGFRG